MNYFIFIHMNKFRKPIKPKLCYKNQPEQVDETSLQILDGLVSLIRKTFGQEMLWSESINGVERDIEQRQVAIAKLREKIAKIDTYIQKRKAYLKRLRALNKS